MILFLRLFFLAVLGSMLWVTTWATLGQSIVDFFRGPVSGDRWFIAAMFDAYCGFLTFYVWVAYKETSFIARLAWLVAILLLGNIAMSIYCLNLLFRAPVTASFADIILRRPSA